MEDKEFSLGNSELIKLFLMQGYPLIFIFVLNYSWLLKSYVIMFISWGQLAWVDFSLKNTSTYQRLYKECPDKNNKEWFEKWLVGITDGEGTFGFYNQNGKWVLVIK